MRKILALIVLVLALFVLTSCDLLISKEDKALRETRALTKQVIVDLADVFGDPEDTDFDWEEDFLGDQIYGNAKLVISDEDSSINMIYYDEDEMFMLEFVLDSTDNSRTESIVWNLIITYANITDEVYIELDYYFYQRAFRENYEGIPIDYGYKEFAEMLYSLQPEDIAWILNELGYEEAEEYMELSFEAWVASKRLETGQYWR